MSENIINNATLTEKEIFDQILLLQKQLTENSPTSLHRLGEAIYDARGEGEDAKLSDEQVESICAVFAQREETLNQMLSFYQRMYNDLHQENKTADDEELRRKDQSEKIELIEKAFDRNMAFINDSDLEPQDKFAALGYVTDKIADLVKTVLVQTESESEAQIKRRKDFLDFVSETVIGAEPGIDLPDFEKLWKTVFLGQ